MPLNFVATRTPTLRWLALATCLVACSSSTGNGSGAGTGSGSGTSGASGASSNASGSSGDVGSGATNGAGPSGAGASGQATGSTSGSAASGSAAGPDLDASSGATGAETGASSAPEASAGTGALDGAAASDAPGSSTGAIVLPPITGNVKIMVLGSSNELGSCWRAYLWQKLHDAGITNFDFIGSVKSDPGCGVGTYDTSLEAHSGWIIEDITLDGWVAIFKANPPDIVLEHNGGADLLANHPYANVIKAYTLGVEAARMVNPRVIYLAAQHTPQMPDNADVMMLNAAMVPWAAGITTAESPVALVDLFTGINSQTDMSDGVHLNDMGSEIVSDRWFAALSPILKP
jgi:hypothetical protein